MKALVKRESESRGIQRAHVRRYDSGKLAVVNKYNVKPWQPTLQPRPVYASVQRPTAVAIKLLPKERPRLQERAKDKIRRVYTETMRDLREMLASKKWENHEGLDIGSYHLGIDYVRARTYSDQEDGFLRYQLSWGGPQDEFRLFEDGRIEYWFLDWGDGAKLDVTGQDKKDVLSVLKIYVDHTSRWPQRHDVTPAIRARIHRAYRKQ